MKVTMRRIAIIFSLLATISLARELRIPRRTDLESTKDSEVPFPCYDEELCDLLVNHQNNKMLEDHSNYFQNASGQFGRIYDIGVDAYTVDATPKNLAYKIYSAVGYAPANVVLVKHQAADGFILMDCGTNGGEVKAIIEAFQAHGVLSSESDKFPLSAIIYSHNHLDHVGAAATWLSFAQKDRCPVEKNNSRDGTYFARQNCVEIVSHKKTTDSVINIATRTGRIIDVRGNYHIGGMVIGGPISVGVGPDAKLNGGPPVASYEPASKTVSQFLDFRVEGMKLRLEYVPSEANDEMIVFIDDESHTGNVTNNPDNLSGELIQTPRTSPQSLGSGALLAGEALQGPPAFPNLYSMRGTVFRSPLTWYESVDKMRLFDSWCVIGTHGVPIMGKENVQLFMTNFRDAVQFVHDQTLRYMRLGYIPDELVTLVPEIPHALISSLDGLENGLPTTAETPGVDPRDHLRSMYGTVPQAVRAIYSGYLGWNQGDPTYFKPLPPTKRANKYLRIMGGVCSVLEEAQASYDIGVERRNTDNMWKEHVQWAAELLSYILSANTVCPRQVYQARVLKAKALLRLASSEETDEALLESDLLSLNAVWRNWLVSSGQELAMSAVGAKYPMIGSLGSAGNLQGVPPRYWLQQWCWRFKPEQFAEELDGYKFGWEFKADGIYWGEIDVKCVVEVNLTHQVLRLIADEQLVESIWEDVDLAVSIEYRAFEQLLLRDDNATADFGVELVKMIENGNITRIKGRKSKIGQFFSRDHFEHVPAKMPNVAERPVPKERRNIPCQYCEQEIESGKKKKHEKQHKKGGHRHPREERDGMLMDAKETHQYGKKQGDMSCGRSCVILVGVCVGLIAVICGGLVIYLVRQKLRSRGYQTIH